MDMNVTIRSVEGRDISAIAELEHEIFAEPWTAEGFSEACAREDNIFLVIDCGQEIAGYALLYGMLDEGEIPTIAVAPGFRERGLGEKLLKQLLLEGEARGIFHIFLEVRESNFSAQKLYSKVGFEVVGRRKRFYRFPEEDALVMARHGQ